MVGSKDAFSTELGAAGGAAGPFETEPTVGLTDVSGLAAWGKLAGGVVACAVAALGSGSGEVGGGKLGSIAAGAVNAGLVAFAAATGLATPATAVAEGTAEGGWALEPSFSAIASSRLRAICGLSLPAADACWSSSRPLSTFLSKM